MDSTTTLEDLKRRVRTFCEDRDWDQFHGCKELAIGLVTEAAELLDHFRFLSDEQVAARLADPVRREEIEDELADVLFFLLRFGQRNGIDLDAALQRKIKKNDARYPVDKARGRNLKHDEL